MGSSHRGMTMTSPSELHAFPLAFPDSMDDRQNVRYGMTLRDYFAAKAMQGILAGTLTPQEVWSQDEVAELAYNVADAMLKAREA